MDGHETKCPKDTEVEAMKMTLCYKLTLILKSFTLESSTIRLWKEYSFFD